MRRGSGALNTQTHVLLALAVFARGEGDAPARAGTPRAVALALALGALLPDASLFVMWGQAKLAGVPESVIWTELYYSDFWQTVGAMTNSAPLFVLLAALGRGAGGRLAGARPEDARADAGASKPRLVPSIALAVGVAALLHVATDLPLHHDDGHPHFWPLSDWIYASPVSYWDPAHHGTAWSLIEAALAALLIVLLWRRSRAWWAKALLALAGLSYAGVVAYFTAALG